MRKNPSTRWFFNDWFNDKALHACSLAAQGAWMRMLCICAENDGYLLIDGKQASLRGLSLMLNVHTNRGRVLVSELESNGVFSRTDTGVIYNRRMVRQPSLHTPPDEINKRQETQVPTPPSRNAPVHDAHAPARLPNSSPRAPNSTSPLLQESTPLPPSKGVFEKTSRKRNQTRTYNHNGVTEHTPNAGPLTDPVQLAIMLGIRHPNGRFINPPDSSTRQLDLPSSLTASSKTDAADPT